MNFNSHFELEGQHAFLSPSKYHWINYDEEKVIQTYVNSMNTQEAVEMHAIAKNLIEKQIRLPKSNKTFNAYVNDAIGYRMIPEQKLKYSNICFGTADSILPLDLIFKKGLLRIHDLKMGVTPAHMEQLAIYASLFCLEYKVKPSDIEIELRLYQNDEVLYHKPTAEDIVTIIDKIITFDKLINKIKEQEG